VRIAFVIDFFDERKGGAEAYLGAVARRLIATGHQVELYARAWRDLPVGVRGHELSPRPLPRPIKRVLRPATELAFAVTAARRLRHEGHDVVLAIRNVLHATHYQPHGGARRATLRGIGEARGHPLRRAWYWCDPVSALKEAIFLGMERHLLAGPDRPRILAVSEMVRRDFERLNGVPREACDLLYPGVHLGRYHPGGGPDDSAALRRHFGVPPGELLLLFAGHNPTLKGLRDFLDAFGRATQRGLRARLMVVGRTALAPYARQAQRLGVHDRVIFAGAISPADMPIFFRGSDVLVHPTFYDPCALVTLEALACGLPVVTTRRNGAADLIQDGRQGFVIDHPRQHEAMADCLQRFAEAGERARMREAAVEVGKGLGFESHFRRLLTLLEEPPARARAAAP